MKKVLLVAMTLILSLSHGATAQKTKRDSKSWAYEACRKLKPETAAALGLAKSSAKTTSSTLRLRATAVHDVSSGTVTDSTLYTYSGLRGMGVDDKLAYDVALYLSDEGLGLDTSTKTIQTFNSSDSLLSTTVMFKNDTLENFLKITYTRDAANHVIGEEDFFWDEDAAVWYKIYAASYVCNSAGQWISMTSGSYDLTGTGALTDSSRGVATYNAAGNPVSAITEEWSLTDGTWSNSFQVTNTYDATGVLLQNMITQDWVGSSWENNEKDSYSYDASSRVVSDLYSVWSPDSSDWQRNTETISKYDAVSGRVASELNRSWDSSGVCDTLNMTAYTYNADMLINTIESYNWNTSSHTMALSTIEYYYYIDGMGIANVTGNKAIVSVFPVPASDMVNINIAWEHAQAAQAELYDVQGRVWKQWTLPAGNAYSDKMSVKELPSGNYFIRINGDNNARMLQKLTVQH